MKLGRVVTMYLALFLCTIASPEPVVPDEDVSLLQVSIKRTGVELSQQRDQSRPKKNETFTPPHKANKKGKMSFDTLLLSDRDADCEVSGTAHFYDRDHGNTTIGFKSTDKMVQIKNLDDATIFFEDHMEGGEERMVVKGKVFVEATLSKDQQNASLLEMGATLETELTTGLVYLGERAEHGGVEDLLQLAKAGDAAPHFAASIESMIKDHMAEATIWLFTKLALRGVNATTHACVSPLFQYATSLYKYGKPSPRSKRRMSRFLLTLAERQPPAPPPPEGVYWAPPEQAAPPPPDPSSALGLPFNAEFPLRPYKACGSNVLGQCGLPGQCWSFASGCPGCGCVRGCEYHDHWCTCDGMLHHVCWRMSFGGWEQCSPCVGPLHRAEDNTRRRRFWN